MRKNNRIHGVNDCFSDAIAFMFNMHPHFVPYFAGMKDYVKSVRNFFNKRGYEISPILFHKKYLKGSKYYIVQGLSPRGGEHCVIYKGTKPYYDPNVKGGFLKGKPHTLWKIWKI